MELKVGQRIQLRSVNYPAYFVSRRSDNKVVVSTSGVDTEWIVKSGLVGDGSSISLECVSGGYLRHQSFSAWVQALDQSNKLYKNDASFMIEEGLAGKGISLRSINFPSYRLRHYSGSGIKLEEIDESDAYKGAASFEVVVILLPGEFADV